MNEWPDILRAIESMYPCCDKIYIVYGGKPNTEMRKFLEERKEIYNLKIFDRPFDTALAQRQFLLEKTPKNNWIVSIDADEKLANRVSFGLREYISKIDPEVYSDPKRKIPLVIPINHHNLTKDMCHYDGTPIYHYMKCFYYDRDMVNYATREGGFFTSICYKSQKDKELVWLFPAVEGFALLHYARLNPERLRFRREHINDPRYGNYPKDAWVEGITAILELPKECR